MQELQTLELPILVEMLAKHTSDYIKMMGEARGSQEEFDSCKQTIILLQAEIECRKQTPANTTITNPNINFTEDYT
jgi:hypothetical protein